MGEGFRSLLERFLVFVTVTAFMLTVLILIAPVLNNSEMERILINWFTYITITASGFVFMLIQQIFAREKIKPHLHIVSVFFYVVLVVIICGFAGQMNLPYVLIPFLVIQYCLEGVLNNMFVYHDIFLDECGELEGKDLERHLFHNNLTAIDFSAKGRAMEATLTVLPLILFFVIYSVIRSAYKVPLIAVLFAILFFLCEFLCFFVLGLYRNDIFFGFLGFRDYIKNFKSLFFSAIVIFSAACVFALIFSSNNAWIKLPSKIAPEKNVTRQEHIQESPEVQQYPQISEYLQDFYPEDSNSPAWIFDMIFDVIKWAAIIALFLGLILFFFKPFFSSHFREFWAEGRLIKFLKHIFREIKEFLRYAFSKSLPAQPYATVESKKFGEGIKDFLKRAGRSKEKNEEIDRLTKHFMKIIDWGQSKGIKYKTNLAPAEYTALINTEPAKLAGQLFEKALYDKNILSVEEEKAFIEAVKEIICG